ncbi:MAG: nucleotide exchange factor GrpE [Candidatus Liptonbacteria bacterium]|nr:nucleotide exchange factor GrpE [Candidatus Liptonbacteria bacterium]
MSDKKEKTDDDISFSPDEEGANIVISEKTKKLREDLKQCEAEKKEYLDGWQRAKADFINYKKEEGARMEDMARFITTGLIQDILPVLDSFALALSHGLPKDVEKGVLLIRSQFMDVMHKRGLEEIMVSAGDVFNPEIHESIGEVESDVLQGAIAEEVQGGYRLRGKVIRPARVRLSKEKPDKSPA